MCQSMGGHLVTITSAEEQAFIESTFPNTRGWIGAYGDESGWSWITGEHWSYTHWSPENPDNANGDEWYVHLWSGMSWNDLNNSDNTYGYQTGFYCEFDEYGDATGYSRPGGNSDNSGNTGNTGTPTTTNDGKDFSGAIPISIGQTVDNKSIEEGGQEHVVYKFTTGQAGDYTITMRHPQDYFGSADAIYILSDSAQNHISEEVWFRDEVTNTYTLNGNSLYYLEVWDYVIFTVTYGSSGGNTDTSGGDGYWKLTKVTPYIYDEEKYNIEGTSSHNVRDYYGEDVYDRTISETESGGLITYSWAFETHVYGDYSGTGTAQSTYTFPKTAYAPEETAVITLGVSADDTGDGYASINISADFWRGSHTADNLNYTQSSRFTDDDGNYICKAASPNSDNAPNTSASLTVKGKMPSAPTDLSDEKKTIINIRIGGSYKGHVVYTYEWTGGSMPSDVGAASGYIHGTAPTTPTTPSITPDGINGARGSQGAKDGKITISLMWDSEDDLDLHVFTPNGMEIWHGDKSWDGGFLDIDANSPDNMKDVPIENVYFPNPKSGEYWIYVYNYEDRTPGQSTNWIVRVQVGSDEEQIYSGTITNQEEAIEVLGFNYTAAVG